MSFCLFLDDSGAISPLSTPSNSFMPNIGISSKDVISALSLTLRRCTVLMVFLLWFSKLVLQSLHPALVNYFTYVFLLQPSLLARNVLSFSLCRRRETPLNPLITLQFL